MRPDPSRRATPPSSQPLRLVRGVRGVVWLLLLTLSPLACNRSPARLDWSTWQRLPTFHEGRIMPVNSLAREAVEKICGRVDPRLSPPGPAAGADLADQGGHVLFPDHRPRQFASCELLFSWLCEPKQWEHVPFLAASHEQLRTELLEVPATDAQGRRLQYVSPWQVEHAEKLRAHLREFQQRRAMAVAHGQRFVASALDTKAAQLWEAYSLYRMLTYDPIAPVAGRSRFENRLGDALDAWQGLREDVSRMEQIGALGPAGPKVAQLADVLEQLHRLAQSGDIPLAEVEKLVVSAKEGAGVLAGQFVEHRRRAFSSDPPPHMDAAQFHKVRAQMQWFAARTADLLRKIEAMHGALYDSGYALRLVPAIDAAALEANRDTDSDAQPWLSLQALLYGSPELLAAYPPEGIQAARTALRQVQQAYLDRNNPRRSEAFAEAMVRLAGALRALAEQIEPLRQKLPLRHRDEELLAATSYPPPGATWTEVHYYQLDPFYWSWVVNACALVALSLAVGIVRKPMFWIGLVVLVAAQLVTVYGFGLRVAITGWAPVTNMFETVVFVSLVVAVLALGFTLQPVFGPGLREAWRLSGIPGTWESGPAGHRKLPAGPNLPGWARIGLALAVALLRLGLAGAVFWALAIAPYGVAENRAVFDLLPRRPMGAALPSAMDLLAWLVGIVILAVAVYGVPRAVVAAALGLLAVPWVWRAEGVHKSIQAALARKPFALVGAAVALVVAVLAYFMPVWDKDLNPLMPILRDRLWLFAHVLTITAGYGAGALAWGLGNIALTYYLFGRYRMPAGEPPSIPGETHKPAPGVNPAAGALVLRPPEACASLAHFTYRAVQVAFLLLAVGTILGGVWADRAWGRFWGWDPKEVWALISVLVYLALMHGRYAGWIGHFGLAAGSVLGMACVVWAWYGVNFLMGPGLHSYAGEGSGGGGLYVLGAFAVNLLYVLLAWLRYFTQTRARPA